MIEIIAFIISAFLIYGWVYSIINCDESRKARIEYEVFKIEKEMNK